MIVTKIEPCTKTRFKVDLDGEFAFVLYKGELSRFGIRQGEEISSETVGTIRTEVVQKRARLRALHLLSDMDRTESALREKLRQGLYPPDAVDGAIEYVRSFGYLDDARYAENYVRSRQGTKSRKEIRAALLQKGVSEEQISLAFELCCEEGGEEEAVRRLIRKKGYDLRSADDAQMQKIYGFFARKGFRCETVRQVIQNYNEDA
ncbi:RecX family transcriptional regulator [Ruminococcus sp. CLA-AA-H200]|uniref:Regulatory protein RecX n=1 Tax=Ruminococcus turbiniformis TaxID=2881258 RepID=A0ABS8FVI0_9FIRM|nr:RecX family transcriptional regulator [Ruminococcus turbiniformis]MCC2254058.1 RecX family transcriptional regulator [Ruminococcus turbiniformis]